MDGPDPPRSGDAFGAALLEALGGGEGVHVLERDDGFVDAMRASLYFAEPDGWPEPENETLDLVSGRVLDVGAGAGRHSLTLQRLGHEVVAIDVSEGAIEVCRARGVSRTFLGPLDEYAETGPGAFDTILLLGHNLGLLESRERSAAVFDLMSRLLAPGGSLVGSGMDPYLTNDPIHLAYHERNRQRGRSPGQVRLRVRHRDVAGDWFDYLYASPEELHDLAGESGWRMAEVAEFEPSYLAVLRPA
jgi:SAM-dependent methyltransferase